MQPVCDIENGTAKAAAAAAAPTAAPRKRIAAAATVVGALGALALFGFAATQGSSTAAGAAALGESLEAPVQRKLYGDINWGVTTSTRSLDSWHSEGINFQSALLYVDVNSINSNWWQYNVKQPLLDKGYGATITLRFTNGNLQNVNDGSYDGQLKQLGGLIGSSGKEVWLRPLHEFNGDWYSWGAFKGNAGNSEDDFKNAYRHVVETVRGAGGGAAKWQLAYNNENPNDDNSVSFGSFYPGGDVVDMLLASAYNRCGTDGWHTSQDSFETTFKDAYYKLKSVDGSKPIGVAEVSTTGNCGDKAAWFQDAFNTMKGGEFNLAQVDWFLEDYTDGADWSIGDGVDVFQKNI